mgnify:CR=1 FL=1
MDVASAPLANIRAATPPARSRCPSSPIIRRATKSSASPPLHGRHRLRDDELGPPENTAVPFGSVKPVWGNPTPETLQSEMARLPCVGIARTAGLKLRQMLEQGPVRIWMRANVENGWRPVQITVGEIKGRTDDFVVVGGHQDSGRGRRRPTTPPAMPVSSSWRGYSASTATSCVAASSPDSGPGTRRAP